MNHKKEQKEMEKKKKKLEKEVKKSKKPIKLRSKRNKILLSTLSCIQDQLTGTKNFIRELIYEKENPKIKFEQFSFILGEDGLFHIDFESKQFGSSHGIMPFWVCVDMLNAIRRMENKHKDDKQ